MPTRIYVGIVNYVGFFLLAPHNYFLLAPTSDLPWKWKSPEIPTREFLFAFAGALELIPFGVNLDLRRNWSAGTSELVNFGASSDLLWDMWFPEIPYCGLLLVSPRWGLLWLFVRLELHISMLGIYYTSPFLGNYIYLWYKYLI